jgi:hypothetical protein
VTSKKHCTLLQASVTSKLTGVVPIWNKLPDSGVNVILASEHPPVTEAVNVATVPVSLRNWSAVFGGQTTVSGNEFEGWANAPHQKQAEPTAMHNRTFRTARKEVERFKGCMP